jgi:uncharacterized CHY-type Zn-finger protein
MRTELLKWLRWKYRRLTDIDVYEVDHLKYAYMVISYKKSNFFDLDTPYRHKECCEFYHSKNGVIPVPCQCCEKYLRRGHDSHDTEESALVQLDCVVESRVLSYVRERRSFDMREKVESRLRKRIDNHWR